MQTRALSNQAVFRGSVQFQTELEGGVTVSGNVNVKVEMPMDEQKLKEVVHRPEDSIEAVLVGLSSSVAGSNGHSKQPVKES